MVYIPKYRILIDKREDKQIYRNPKNDYMVYILEEPYWRYHIIDELEQYQLFPKKLKYLETNTILERVGISKNRVVYRIITEDN